VFARQVLREVHEVEGVSIAKLAAAVFDTVADPLDDAPAFVVHAYTPLTSLPSLGSRARLVKEALLETMKEKRRRTFRRYLEPPPEQVFSAGTRVVQLLLTSATEGRLSLDEVQPLRFGGWDLAPWPAGDAPVARDRTPPSRAYQKAEEAYLWMGACPGPGETVVDLGGSPGGWTYTALKRGAHVTAVDRAPLEAPVAGHPQLTEILGDAFRYIPAAAVDWLLCDVIAEPARSLELIKVWLEQGLARALVVTIKFKGSESYGQLDVLPELFARIKPRFARVKHLAHNKNEVTVMVRV
jgi:23S rRNA (cytidine2498-2'-O)-methyltransferase